MIFIITLPFCIISLIYGMHLGHAQAEQEHIKALKKHADTLQEFIEDNKRREAELQTLKKKVVDLTMQAVKMGILRG